MAARPRPTHDRDDGTESRPTATELLDLFGDEYTRRVFEAVSERPRGGRAVAEAADVSRATAYRRLNELRDAGLVTSEHRIAADGHHREQFAATARHLSISLDDGDIEASVSLGR